MSTTAQTGTAAMGGEIVPYATGQPAEYRPQIMTPEAARALDEQVRMCTRAVLREGTDYGIIPGTNGDKVLFRPGAQKLLQWFGLGFTCERVEIEHDDDGRKHGITYRAMVARRLPDGSLDVKATCEGTADYDEDKFYQSAETVQRKAEAKERMWAQKDRRVANPEKWKHLGEYRAPWNSLMKRAQKRAIVGAVIDATAAGGLFAADDDSDSAPADGGPSWYQQALGEAAAITTKEDGDRLCNEATRAVLSGLATPGQATHVKNRVDYRLRQLGTVVAVDVEDLAKATAAHGLRPPRTPTAPPAQPHPPAASATPPSTADAGGALPPLPGEEETPSGAAADAAPDVPDDTDYDTPGTVTGPMLTAIWTVLSQVFHFSKDEKEQARMVCAHIVDHDLKSSSDLSKNEGKAVLDTLAHWQQQASDKGEHPRDYLIATMAAQDGARGDE